MFKPIYSLLYSESKKIKLIFIEKEATLHRQRFVTKVRIHLGIIHLYKILNTHTFL